MFASEAGGGKAVTLKNGKAACTHVLARQQCQASCEWGEEAQKTLVNPLWLWESYEGGSLLPLSDPVGVNVAACLASCTVFSCRRASAQTFLPCH